MPEHIDSYYAATINDPTRRPSLSGSTRADVCIIGGGFTGVAAALTLAERGMDVVLLEQHRIGWGASGRNGGQLIGGLSGERRLLAFHGAGAARVLYDIAWRGNELVEERIERHGIECDFKRGYVDLAIKSRHMRDFAAQESALRAHGFKGQLHLLDRRELREILASDAYVGGLLNGRSGHLHPLNLVLGEARVAAALGARLFEQTEVTGIVHGTRPRVRTGLGEVDARFVLIAGNAYHGLERRTMSGLVFPAGSFIIATGPLAESDARALNPRDLAFSDANHVLDYFRLSADRRLLFGGRCNYSGREPSSITASIVPRMLKVFPQLAGRRIDYEWGGRIGIVVNRVPLIGRTTANVFYAMGYSGHGVNFSHVAAEIVADAIAGQMERFDLFARMPHRRFPFDQRLGNQLIALGMLYYRIKDLM